MSGEVLDFPGSPVQVEPMASEQLELILAALYGVPREAVAWMAQACTQAWVAFEEQVTPDDTLSAGLVPQPDSEPAEAGKREVVLGAVGTRPSPAHGSELVGGVFAGPRRAEVAAALARAAWQEVGRVYAFAEGHLFPPEALVQAGFREVGAYRRLEGRVPYRHVDPPDGVTLRPLAEISEAARLEALHTVEDRVGHHAALPEAAQDGAGGFDSHLSHVALDDQGRAIGICRAAIEEGLGRLDSPGVAVAWRHTNLRAALLNSVNARLRAAGITRLSVDSWGDTAEELAHDLRLGLHVADETPILASP
ncbi:hypothetical protein [Deinococcus sp.]|uniref:hypothetical protein n=1 Tax=Deinococcus sp. TaxID=47478 RepID=UPI0025BCF57B|nr:hypothetical protein [Deinococcus sp.]